MTKATLYFFLALVAFNTAAAIPSGKYLMSYHACDRATTDCTSPRNHNTYLAESNDGASWTTLNGFVTQQGSVPDLIRRGNKLYAYIPQRMSRYNLETNSWEGSNNVTITHADGSVEAFVDPSPIFDENGNIVLFYLASNGSAGADPAVCASGETSCTKTFRSASEVAGSDGTRFLVDSGNRAEVTITSTGSAPSASDPDIFAHPGGYVMYVSRGTSVQVLTASTLKGSYSNVAGLSSGLLVDNSGGIPAGHYDSATAQYWTYVTSNQRDGSQLIRRAVHAGLGTKLVESDFSTVLSASTVSGLTATSIIASPGFALNETGNQPTISVRSSGGASNLTLSADLSIASGDIGRSGSYYLVALFQGQLFANNGSTWASATPAQLPSFATVTALPTLYSMAILQATNVSALSGATIYTGYGTSLSDMLNNSKFRLVYTVP